MAEESTGATTCLAMYKLLRHLQREIVEIDRQVERRGDNAGHLRHIRSTLSDTLNWAELYIKRSKEEA